MSKWNLTWYDVKRALAPFDKEGNYIFAVPNGGLMACSRLEKATLVDTPECANLILDDIEDSGRTRDFYNANYPLIPFRTLFNRAKFSKVDEELPWIVFPWDSTHPKGEQSVEENIVRLLQYIGEDPTREGLLETPKRVIKSYAQLFSGYSKSPKDVLTVFEPEGYDQIIISRDIEFYSMCEHHMLPFFGVAHVAYIPGKKVIGISKLARLVEIYARRLQIQERMGAQIVQALDEYLLPVGAACVIEATHMCQCARGVNKQGARMVTSSITGVFRDNPAAKEELMFFLKS